VADEALSGFAPLCDRWESAMRILAAVRGSLTVIAIFVLAEAAVAAPQILGVSASFEPIPLTCEEGKCSAELASFCLQKKRDDPNYGDAYTIFDNQRVKLHLTAMDGREWSVRASDHVHITAERSFTAVKVEIDEDTLAQLGAKSARLSVAQGVSLVPIPVPDDPDPITERELAYVTGKLRPKADLWVGGDNTKPRAIRIINRVLNAVPKTGRLKTSERDQLWQKVVGKDKFNPADAGHQHALKMYGACKFRVEVGRYFNLRRCLGVKQDSLMLDMNTRYWQSLDLGS
jgi:hypothetical protein